MSEFIEQVCRERHERIDARLRDDETRRGQQETEMDKIRNDIWAMKVQLAKMIGIGLGVGYVLQLVLKFWQVP